MNWKEKHYEVMLDFLKWLNKKNNDFILKDSTALLMCYQLDRFSENLDFDGKRYNFPQLVESYAKEKGYECSIKKETKTVERVILRYGNELHPLKLEVSYRNIGVGHADTVYINDIQTYNIDELTKQKAKAYSQREKLRDCYDVSFITNTYWNVLSPEAKREMIEAVDRKGIDQCEFLIQMDTKDPLIDTEKLKLGFYKMFEKMNLVEENSKILE